MVLSCIVLQFFRKLTNRRVPFLSTSKYMYVYINLILNYLIIYFLIPSQVEKLDIKDRRLNDRTRYNGSVRGKKKTLSPSIAPKVNAPKKVFLKQTMLSNIAFLKISFNESETVVSKG